MTMVNAAYGQLPPAFFFTRLNDTVAAYELAHPDKGLLRLGVGDVTGPLSLTVIEALRRAVSEQSRRETFHGYLPENGMAFFKAAVAAYYGGRNVSLSLDEIFVSSGAADDLGALGNLFSPAARVLVTEPAYPAYVDTSRMAGRKILHLQGTRENGFLPLPGDDLDADLVYLCSPNNPTGTAYTRPQLQRWVDWANDRQAVILFDAAYEAFVQDGDVPKELVREGFSLHDMWTQDRTTRTNGVSYVLQRAGEAALSPAGLQQNRAAIAVYQENGRILSEALRAAGVYFTGGRNAPYLWLPCPQGMTGWAFFDHLLREAQIVVTPGEGFGAGGAGHVRLSCFGSREDTKEAAHRLLTILKKGI